MGIADTSQGIVHHSSETHRVSKNQDAVERLAQATSNAGHPLSQKFIENMLECIELHAKKQRDYGADEDPFANVRASEGFGVPAWLGAVIRGNDKVSRLKSYATKGSLANEGVEDSLRDLAVYAMIGLTLFQELQENGE